MAKKIEADKQERVKRERIDWETIARDYRAGMISIRAIAKKHSVSDKAIRDKAEQLGWTRDLSDRIRTETKSALLRTAEGGNDEQIVAEKVQEGVAIIRTHQKAIGRGQEVCEAIMESLSARLANADELEAFIVEETKDDENTKRRAAMLKLIDLPAQAEVAQKLSNTMKTFIGLQRQAHGIDANPEPPKDDLMDLLAGIDGMTAGLPFKQKE